MTGIYKITNLITNQCYIGQSINIKRRLSEHKTPKANGNNKLHEDIQKNGVINFKFEILEECNKNELKPKELFYIKKYKPFYNYVGKNLPIETKDKISITTRSWWNNLEETTKNKIIKNNLTYRAKKGHCVSKDTRNKISKWVSENQGKKVKIVETGQVFEKIIYLEKFLGASTGTYAKYKKGLLKSVKGFNVVECRD